MSRKYLLTDPYEFLDLIKATESSRGVIVFLDVENLLTNVPVDDTVQIVRYNVYYNIELAPPSILPVLLRDMLLTCTKETSFVTPT